MVPLEFWSQILGFLLLHVEDLLPPSPHPPCKCDFNYYMVFILYFFFLSITGKISVSCGYRKDTKSFLFTLHNTNGYYPEKLALTNSQYAIYDCHSYPPRFGSDLRLEPTSRTSSSGCYAYACANYPLISPTSFKPDEIEVFNEEAPPGTSMKMFLIYPLFKCNTTLLLLLLLLLFPLLLCKVKLLLFLEFVNE